jgi:hypothetical protein
MECDRLLSFPAPNFTFFVVRLQTDELPLDAVGDIVSPE